MDEILKWCHTFSNFFSPELMKFQMPVEIGVSSEVFITSGALERFVPNVGPDVRLKVRELCERPRTDLAVVRSVLEVDARML